MHLQAGPPWRCLCWPPSLENSSGARITGFFVGTHSRREKWSSSNAAGQKLEENHNWGFKQYGSKRHFPDPCETNITTKLIMCQPRHPRLATLHGCQWSQCRHLECKNATLWSRSQTYGLSAEKADIWFCSQESIVYSLRLPFRSTIEVENSSNKDYMDKYTVYKSFH